jgi:hydrogenase-1 operon protein HyaE
VSELAVSDKMHPAAQSFDALLNRLVEKEGFVLISEHNVDAFVSDRSDVIVLCTENPVQYPECWDVAVVLPELLRQTPGRFRVGIAAAGESRKLQARFGFGRYPAMVFLRGGYVGVIEGMRDWGIFIEEMTGMLEKPVSNAPGIGIAVAPAAASGCHQ